MTKFLNHLYYAVCLLVAMLSELPLDVLPENWKHKIAVVAVMAAWVKGHWNLFVNPNGTPAETAWESPTKGKT